ncbi:hypothetical protein LPJ77_004072 [Coemansia sp. RSA 2523]|nr:hypothetical protein LPJ58_002513 [Coemansia sp. RSA 1591]KAJ1763462.1 hypothetical protein LPJ69_002458 [Coemansia sp. RSA 1752]KAJ1775322.1 hypothetical protein LPJ54_003764 [Coemansia sp. RSA 1824]KAJ1789695.1 hypothetical protein LPJ67_002409 [Coemansia sp. RSA 1938]KAJ1790389.1 hypothetical protein LPJ62_001964 [Coemansia sp. RSA 2167]KAJ1805691.1 hypothetical protein LPJ77_004072 [Coemansia sp. RSA 2523]KAJ2126936.1 hypothetical protein GGH17_004880 [Coemansia sp. RSA 788]KAJ2142123
MDATAAKAFYDYIATTVVGMPPAPLSRLLSVNFSTAEDARIISDGISRARIIYEQKNKLAQAEYVLAQLAKAAVPTSGTALSPQTMARITATLEQQPEILQSVPLNAENIRMYAKNCWNVLVTIINMTDSSSDVNCIIQSAIVQPMNIVEHNSLAQLLIDQTAAISADTLFKYLNAVEASCRAQQSGSAQVHNVRLASKVFNHALDANSALAETMSIELGSFCLSYTRVKDATDLYRRILTTDSTSL